MTHKELTQQIPICNGQRRIYILFLWEVSLVLLPLSFSSDQVPTESGLIIYSKF